MCPTALCHVQPLGPRTGDGCVQRPRTRAVGWDGSRLGATCARARGSQPRQRQPVQATFTHSSQSSLAMLSGRGTRPVTGCPRDMGAGAAGEGRLWRGPDRVTSICLKGLEPQVSTAESGPGPSPRPPLPPGAWASPVHPWGWGYPCWLSREERGPGTGPGTGLTLHGCHAHWPALLPHFWLRCHLLLEACQTPYGTQM